MSDLTPLKTEEIEEIPVRTLRVYTGGKGPPNISGSDWLSELPKLTVFLCRPLNDPMQVSLTESKILNKTEKGVLLWTHFPQGSRLDWVSPIRFCKEMECVEILKMNKKENE